ncbi:MAG: alpha/beta hydrolase family protein [Sulfitobacter sp.]
MATFVLVHGAWHGGWCWAPTEDALRAKGHKSFAPTMTGLGDRSHLLRGDITADSHVEDIVNFINWRDLENVILVGHSYGGMVVTGVAGRIADKISGLVYLDAFVPDDSDVSLFAQANPERMARFQTQVDAGAIAVEPDTFDSWTDNPVTKEWLIKKCTPQPFGTLQNGVTLTGRENDVAHKHYIVAGRNKPSAFWAQYEKVRDRPGWTSDSIDSMHDAMVDAADDLAEKLDAYASFIGAD